MADDETTQSIDCFRFVAFANGAYNADREAYLDSVHRWLMFSVVVFGASALIEALPPLARQIATALTAVAGAFDLVFDLTARARKHAYLRREYFGQAAKLASGQITGAEADAAMLELAADEEPPFYAVHALAENWASRAVFGDAKKLPCRVGWFRRLLRHQIRFDGHSFACVPSASD